LTSKSKGTVSLLKWTRTFMHIFSRMYAILYTSPTIYGSNSRQNSNLTFSLYKLIFCRNDYLFLSFSTAVQEKVIYFYVTNRMRRKIFAQNNWDEFNKFRCFCYINTILWTLSRLQGWFLYKSARTICIINIIFSNWISKF
jgi:hypothetical protein